MILGKLIKSFGFFIIMGAFIVGSISVPSLSEAAPQSAKPKKQFVVNYVSYNKVLKGLVLVKRGNTRKPKLRASPPTGTRISWANKKITRYESNRFMFHMLKDSHKIFISNTRQALEAIPAEFPLDSFSKDEQLAYWLNLRNLTVLESVMELYPIRKLKHPWKKIANNKRLTVAGKQMSVNDIEALIIKQWPHPQVIYGFFKGTVGGPNLRKRAFTGRFVWDDLQRNAKEFINSLKGIQFSRTTAKVSEFYENYPSLFPDLKNDVKTHMLANLRPKLGDQLTNSKKIKFNISDWSIADLMNGRLGLSSPGSIGPAALINTVVLSSGGGGASGPQGGGRLKAAMTSNAMNDFAQYSRYPAHVQSYLEGMKESMRESLGEVTIEEVDSKTTDIKVKEEEKEEKEKKKKKN